MLTVHQLASVVAADLSPHEVEHELRRARRFAYHGQAKITMSSAPNAPSQEVSVLDLSARGLRMLYPVRLARGATFVARLPRIGQPELAVLCTVAHCQQRPNGMFTIGVEFTCVLSDAPTAEDNEETQNRIRSAILHPESD
jgi:hypothetical protein